MTVWVSEHVDGSSWGGRGLGRCHTALGVSLQGLRLTFCWSDLHVVTLLGSPQLDMCSGTEATKYKTMYFFFVISRLSFMIGQGTKNKYNQLTVIIHISIRHLYVLQPSWWSHFQFMTANFMWPAVTPVTLHFPSAVAFPLSYWLPHTLSLLKP